MHIDIVDILNRWPPNWMLPPQLHRQLEQLLYYFPHTSVSTVSFLPYKILTAPDERTLEFDYESYLGVMIQNNSLMPS